MNNSSRLRILCNDYHVNLPESTKAPQGGPARFAQVFSDHMQSISDGVELVSLLFSHDENTQSVTHKKTVGVHDFYEVFYNPALLRATYKEVHTKDEYVQLLAPWSRAVDAVLAESAPDIVFLNGFSLMNWILLDAAYRNNIPVCIQHAGIWKKELTISQGHFSQAMREIFYEFEKETIQKAAHQIFLNEFSREVFFAVHDTVFTDEIRAKTSIVPLPVENTEVRAVGRIAKDIIRVGGVARWDSIKNHSAFMRLAEYSKEMNVPIETSVVTRVGDSESDFKTNYVQAVHIVAPMEPVLLREFYQSQDCILIPSNFDVSPTVLMESVIAGVPAIISDQVGWVSDYQKFGLEDLIISPSASGEVIANVVQKVIGSIEYYRPKFEALQQKIIQEHNPLSVFQKYYQIFIQMHSYDNSK